MDNPNSLERFYMKISFNVILNFEAPWFVATCLDNKVASQGLTVFEALDNLKEALELFYENAEELPDPNSQALFTTLEVNLQ
jgi:predicted RNase H-like HicB family nuclease